MRWFPKRTTALLVPHTQDTPVVAKFVWPEGIHYSENSPYSVARIFPANSHRIIVVVPGYASNGRKPKYEELITAIMQQGNSAVVSTNNLDPYDDDIQAYARHALGQVTELIQYILQNSEAIIGSNNPAITLYGSSAGGGSVALSAAQFPQVDSLILTGPSQEVLQGLGTQAAQPFTGKVSLIRTAEDGICSPATVQAYRNLLSNASEFDEAILPGSDHAFDQPDNQKALIQYVLSRMTNLAERES